MAAIFRIRMRDGTILEDVASIASNKRLKRRLNRPSECSFRVPSYLVNEIQSDGLPLICAGYRQVEVVLDSTGLFFHGIIWNVEDEGDEDMVYSAVTAYDPMVLWRYRPARDLIDSYSGDAGNLSDPSFIQRNQTGPQIMEEILLASENYALAPAEAEGQLFLDLYNSTYAVGGQDLRGAPTNWPMSIADIATLLTNTGELDIVIQPLVGGTGSTIYTPTPGSDQEDQDNFQNIGTVHCYNGNYGTDRTASVNFDFSTGDYNARLLRRTDNMDTIGTKINYFLGPRLDQQHWAGSVTGSVLLPSNPTIEAARLAAQAALGIFFPPISIYDSLGSEITARPLYEYSWLVDTVLRLQPREMVYITPVRDGDFGPGDFDIGDLVTVNVGNRARKTSSGGQRIYSYVIDIDDDAVEALGEFECSPDQDEI